MRILQTETLAEELLSAPSDVHLWAYNGFDVLMPHEILAAIDKKMSQNQHAYYNFERNLCGPALSMMLNGVKVDSGYHGAEIVEHRKKEKNLLFYINQLAHAVWGKGLNIKSPQQMKEFFYTNETGFKIKPKFSGSGTKRRVSCDRKALEKVYAESFYARPLINAMFQLKDIAKSLEFLERGIEKDGRVRCSFNVAATESGRWSSSHNPWRRGGNFQNQSESIRKIYIADEDYVFAYPDLSAAEAYGVAYYSEDENYIAACRSGDVHTGVAKLVFKELPWNEQRTGVYNPLDRRVAETPFYRHLTYRDMAKRGAHGSNYGGQAFALARELQVPEERADEFQTIYFERFPGIQRWHHRVQRELQSARSLSTALGRERLFLGRTDSRDTLKEALAWLPQSLISDILKIGMLRIWRKYELRRGIVKLHADMHDGLLFSIKESYLDEVAPIIKNLMTIPIRFRSNEIMTIPVDFTVGYRWQKKEMKNWEPGVLSKLTRPKATTMLDLEAEYIEKT